MNSFVAVLFLAASAAAGGQFGYSTAQGTTHAVGVSAVHAAPVAIAHPAVYAVPQLAYAAPAPVVKTIAPVAQSTAFVNRAPAARLAVAVAQPALVQQQVYAQPALVRSGVVASQAYGIQQVGLGGVVAGPAYL